MAIAASTPACAAATPVTPSSVATSTRTISTFGWLRPRAHAGWNGRCSGRSTTRQVMVSIFTAASSEARHGVALHQLLVELDAEAGPVGDREATVAVDPDLFREHLAEGRGRPARRLVRKLEPGAVRDGGDEVQVREQPDSVGPGVRREEQAGGLGQRGDLAQLVDTLGQHRVRL